MSIETSTEKSMSIDFCWEQLFSFRIFLSCLLYWPSWSMLQNIEVFKGGIWSWNVFHFSSFCVDGFPAFNREKRRVAKPALVMPAASFSTLCFCIRKAGAQIKLTPEGCVRRLQEQAAPQCAPFRCKQLWFRSPYKQPQSQALLKQQDKSSSDQL